MLGVGANIGSMAFLFHGSMIAQAGPLAAITAWVLAAVMSLPLAFILAELASMFPSAGGPYVYKYFALKRLLPGMGEFLGFLTGWMFWIYLVVGYSCMSNGLVNLLSEIFWGDAQAGPLWFGPAVILTLFGSVTALNLVRITSAARMNNLLTLTKISVALVFALLAFSARTSSFSYLLQPTNLSGDSHFWENVMAALPLAIAGFAGIEMCACTASETADARRAVPKAIMATVASVAVIYIGMCAAVGVAAHYVLSADRSMAIIAGTTITATAPSLAGYLGGGWFGVFVTFGVILSIVSCGFSGLLSIARTSLSMAQTGLFPQRFAYLHPTSRVPHYALWFQFLFLSGIGIVAFFLSRTGAVPDAYTFLGATDGFLYGLLALLYGVCLMGLRYTDPGAERPFRLGRGGNRTAWLLALSCGLVFGLAAFACTSWVNQLAGWLLLAAGVPIYAYYRWRK
jgi:amino acid transporter